jgi:predicted ribosome quality control (RQC) complex YloA/Tae2 family protein
MQRKLSSFDIYVIVDELQYLVGSNIDKTYQLTLNELLIKVKNIKTKQKNTIFIRNGELLSVAEKDFEIPIKPSTFAMTLRKYLKNGRISEITQHEFDRILKFKISKKEGVYTLVIELFSNGNIVLVDPEGKIILPFIQQTWAHRSVKGRELYVPPPSQIDPFNLNFDRFSDLLKESNTDIVRTLAVNINLSGPIAEEICTIAKVDKNSKIEEIDSNTVRKLFTALTDFLELFKEKRFEPVLVRKDNKIVDILPFKFDSYQSVDFKKVKSFSEGLEEFIEIKKVEKKIDTETEKLIGKLNRQLLQQEETIKKFEKEIELKKIEGDIIYLNYQELEKLLNEIKEILELKEKESKISDINKKDIVKKFDPIENLLIVNLKNVDGDISEVKLNFRKTVSENAEKAYDDNKKLRNKQKGAERSILKTREKIKLTTKKKIEEEKKEEIKPVKKEKLYWFEKYRWFISSEGNIIIGGKDAKTNELIVKKYLKDEDRYAHADIQGAPSIVIKNKGFNDELLDISEKTLEEACIFAASYSKAWKQFAESQSYWVLPEQVSKTAQSGEFIPKGAFIIRGKRNYYRCKLEIAVGEININGEKKIMAGPIDAVKKRTSRYIVLEPGGIKKNDIARKIAKAFDVNIDIVDRVLPPGGVTVTETVEVDI